MPDVSRKKIGIILLSILTAILLIARFWILPVKGQTGLMVHFFEPKEPNYSNELAMLYSRPRISDGIETVPLICVPKQIFDDMGVDPLNPLKDVETSTLEMASSSPSVPNDSKGAENVPQRILGGKNKVIAVSSTPEITPILNPSTKLKVNPEYLKCLATFETSTPCTYLPVFQF